MDAGRQVVLVDLLQLLLQGLHHLVGIFTPPHCHQTLDARSDVGQCRIIVADRVPQNAGRRKRIFLDRTDVPDVDRDAMLNRNDNILDVFLAPDGADTPHGERLPATLDDVPPRVQVIRNNRVDNVLQCQIVAGQDFGRCDHMVLLHQSAEVDDIRHAGDLQHFRDHHPVLESPQFHGGVFVRRFDHVAKNLADRAREGAERRVDAVGEDGVAELLQHALPREVIVGAVFECELDDRQTEDGFRAPFDDPWHTVERPFEGLRHLLFHLRRSPAGELCDDRDLRVTHIGICFLAQDGPRPDAGNNQARRETERRRAMVQGKDQKLTNHDCSFLRSISETESLQKHRPIVHDTVAILNSLQDDNRRVRR